MGFQAYIFDLDGVICDTAVYHFQAWKKLANSLDIDFTEEENEKLKGVSRVKSLELILEWGGKTLDQATFDKCLIQKNEWYLDFVSSMDQTGILPGVKEFLLNLKANNKKIALGSASKNAKLILQQLGIINLFEGIADGTNVTKSKPDPEVFQYAAELVGSNSNEAIVFEDSIAGIEAAKNGGFYALGIGDSSTLSQADKVFKDFTEFNLSTIENLSNS